MGKSKILNWKSNGLLHSVWEASQNTDCDFRRCNFLALFVPCSWTFSHHVKFHSFIQKITARVVCVNVKHSRSPDRGIGCNQQNSNWTMSSKKAKVLRSIIHINIFKNVNLSNFFTYGLGKAINSCKFCSSSYHMNMTLIKVEILHNTLYKRVHARKVC